MPTAGGAEQQNRVGERPASRPRGTRHDGAPRWPRRRTGSLDEVLGRRANATLPVCLFPALHSVHQHHRIVGHRPRHGRRTRPFNIAPRTRNRVLRWIYNVWNGNVRDRAPLPARSRPNLTAQLVRNRSHSGGGHIDRHRARLVTAALAVREGFRPPPSGMHVKRKEEGGRDQCASSYCFTTSAATRPRPETSIPCFLAHSRTAARSRFAPPEALRAAFLRGRRMAASR